MSDYKPELVRLACGATGVPVGHGLGLFVCAQDNDLGLDRIAVGADPWLNTPKPSRAEVAAVRMAVSYCHAVGGMT